MIQAKNFLISVALTVSCCAVAQTGSVAARVLQDSLFIPWEILYGPDEHIWFTQKNGYVCRMDTAGTHVDTLLHEPLTTTIRESGMLGMVLHPHFADSPFVFVAWEYLRQPDSAITERVVRYTYDFNSKKLGAARILLDSIKGHKYHNGCRLAINDNKLFISVADAADSANAQNLNNVNGKILRLNLDGTVPSDNPFPGSAIWSLGHRNQQGLVVVNGLLYASEHGPNTDDEVNIIGKGRNYGWPYVRGFCNESWETTFCTDSNVVEPLAAWTPTIAPCGIDYYNHVMFPSLRNSLLMTTLKDKHLYRLRLNADYTTVVDAAIVDGVNFGRLRDICVSPDGKIFLSTSNSDPDGNGPPVDRIIVLTNPAFSYARDELLTLYPNPARKVLYIVPPALLLPLQYAIVGIDGRLVQSGNIDPVRWSVDTGTLPPGQYTIKLFQNGVQQFAGHFIHLN
jgi:aldose sugar dehydrogenase